MSGHTRKIKKENAQDLGTHQVDCKVQEWLRLTGVRMVGLVTDTGKRKKLFICSSFQTQLWPSSSGSTGIRHHPGLKYPTAALSKGTFYDDGNILHLR